MLFSPCLLVLCLFLIINLALSDGTVPILTRTSTSYMDDLKENVSSRYLNKVLEIKTN